LKKVIEYIVMASENSDDPNFEICSLDENQVEKACEDLRVKNAELKKAINHMIKENTLYKKKYNVGRCYNEVLHFVKFNFRK
jgi:hypothetical protein